MQSSGKAPLTEKLKPSHIFISCIYWTDAVSLVVGAFWRQRGQDGGGSTKQFTEENDWKKQREAEGGKGSGWASVKAEGTEGHRVPPLELQPVWTGLAGSYRVNIAGGGVCAGRQLDSSLWLSAIASTLPAGWAPSAWKLKREADLFTPVAGGCQPAAVLQPSLWKRIFEFSMPADHDFVLGIQYWVFVLESQLCRSVWLWIWAICLTSHADFWYGFQEM